MHAYESLLNWTVSIILLSVCPTTLIPGTRAWISRTILTHRFTGYRNRIRHVCKDALPKYCNRSSVAVIQQNYSFCITGVP